MITDTTHNPGHARGKQAIQALCQQGKFKEAVAACKKLCDQAPEDAESWFILGAIHGALNNFSDAETACRRSLAIAPDVASTHNNLGIALQRQSRSKEAADSFREAIRLLPGYSDALCGLGNALWSENEYEQAIASFQVSIQHNPANADAYRGLGLAWSHQGCRAEAMECFRQAMKFVPSDAMRIREATVLPALLSNNEEIAATRNEIHENIQSLLKMPLRVDDPVTELGATQFYLAYHGKNDRDLQVEFAKLYLHACPSLEFTAPHCTNYKPGVPGGKIKIGFISRYLMHHSIGKTSRGIIEKLDRDRFTVIVIFLDTPADETARLIAGYADKVVVLPNELQAARQHIAGEALDILFYQDIGMDAFTYFLAFSRLAPVQCTTFGHPVTTGIPAMDYFVSTGYYEPENAQEHYSEKLVTLDDDVASCAYYYRPELPAVLKTRSDFGLGEQDHLYICPQALFKIHPEFDYIMAGILRADPGGKIILIKGTYPVWEQVLTRRFRQHMPDVAGRILFVPPQKDGYFTNLLAVTDVILDTIHFGGQNTTHEGLAAGVPIVTWPGEFHRGRHAYGFYRKMGFLDCVAKDYDDYIDIAVRLGTDSTFRDIIIAKIIASRDCVWEEIEVVHAFERFFINACEKPATRQ